MQSKRSLLPIGLLVTLFLFLFIAANGSSAVFAAGTGDGFSGESAGQALLADSLAVYDGRVPFENGRGGGNWTNVSNMRQSVKQVNGGGHFNGFIYIPGGIINSLGPILHNTMQFYEVATGRWRIDAEPMPSVVTDAAICTDNAGKIHVINGFDSSFTLMSVHMIYDTTAPAGSRWSTASAPQVGGNNYFSQASGCAVIDRVLYLFGGNGNIGAGSAAPLSATWAWDRVTDTWSDTGFSLNTPRYWFGYGSKTNNAYVAGGTNISGSNPLPVASTERFTPGSGWVTGQSLPTALLSPGMVGFEAGVAVFGGGVWNGSSYVLQSTTYLCNGGCPPAAPWNDISMNLNSARWFSGYAGGPPDGPYVAGGVFSGSGSLKTSERLQMP